jgi:hypothetical protein
VIACIALLCGCIVPPQLGVKNPAETQSPATEQKLTPSRPDLIKPSIPDSAPALGAAPTESAAPEPLAAPPHASTKPWEDTRVKSAATDLANTRPTVKKFKICYSVKDDEWWVTLYEPADDFIELKQFTWNRDSEKLEELLVMKRIPAAGLEKHLKEEEPGRACEVHDSSPGPEACANTSFRVTRLGPTE